MSGTRTLLLGGALAFASLVPASGAVAAASGTHAPARTQDVVQSFRNQATDRCMDDTSNGFRTWPCNSTPYQSWF
ncbi:hypothetical protein OG361_40095 [Streptomyces sp. NBC_00090]|uniref:hypothetical protein n=1 Tax=Streptomyces sp. NBC_00090 TaxID=2903619 RepID=UPI00324B986C